MVGEDFLLLRLCRWVIQYAIALVSCTRRVVPNNTNPHDLKKRKKKKIPQEEFFFFPLIIPINLLYLYTRDLISIFTLQYKTLYLYDSHLNYFHLSSSHKKLKA